MKYYAINIQWNDVPLQIIISSADYDYITVQDVKALVQQFAESQNIHIPHDAKISSHPSNENEFNKFRNQIEVYLNMNRPYLLKY